MLSDATTTNPLLTAVHAMNLLGERGSSEMRA